MTPSATPNRRPLRASALLAQILASGLFDQTQVATELAVSPATIDRYLNGSVAIPLERQLCLALFVIEKIPSLARPGHMLHGQVRAAIAFKEHSTVVHQTRPVPGPRSF